MYLMCMLYVYIHISIQSNILEACIPLNLIITSWVDVFVFVFVFIGHDAVELATPNLSRALRDLWD